MEFKKTISATIMMLTSIWASATSYPQAEPLKSTESKTVITANSNNAGTANTGDVIYGRNGYILDATYDDSNFNFEHYNTDNNTVTDVLFFYTEDAVAELGHLENVHLWLNETIKYNNTALANSKTPITRRIAGVLPASLLNISSGLTVYDSIVEFGLSKPEEKFAVYSASYYVLVDRYNTGDEEVSAIGVGALGGKVSVITVNKNTPYIRLLAHELGHNDGLNHDATNGYSLLNSFAIGHACHNSASIMKINGDGRNYNRDVPFFSDQPITNDGENCGVSGVAESGEAYRIAANGGTFTSKTNTFKNIQDTKPVTGSITFDVSEIVVSETQEYFTVPFTWLGQPEQYSSIEVYTEHNTASESDAAYVTQRIYYDYGNQEVAINLNNDALAEDNETIFIKFRHPNGIEIEGIPSIEVTITSDEVINRGTISFDNNAISVTEGSSATLTLIRTGGTDEEISVTLGSTHGSTNDADVSLIQQEVVFGEGEASKTITFATRSDTTEESDETFTVTIAGTYAEENSNATVTIVNVNAAPPTEPKSEKSGGGLGLAGLMLLTLSLVRKKVS